CASSGKQTTSAPASRARAICAAIAAALPSMSPTVVLIWASATRSVLMATAYREAVRHDRAALVRAGLLALVERGVSPLRLPLLQPERVVRGGPVAPHAAVEHAAQGRPRRGVHRRQV